MDKSQSSKFTSGARWVALLLLPALLLIGISNSMAAAPPEPELQRAPLRPGALGPPPHDKGFIPPPMDLSHLTGQKLPKSVEAKQLPDIWDWRTQSGGRVTPAKDQGACGSCYAFGAIGNIESKMMMDGAGTYNFSEDNAKECNWRELNNFQYPNPGDYWGSCDGGNYMMLVTLFSTKGTVLESCDPYQPSDVSCTTGCTYQKTLLDWRMISADMIPNTDVLKQYIYDNGPVTVSMYADDTQGFDGTYDGSYTFDYVTPGSSTNHSVLIVGWSNNLPPVTGNKAQAADGWIVKNSWGTDWGDNGYFYMTYGAGNLGMWASFMHDWQDYDANGDLWYYDDDGWWTSFGETGGSNTTAWGLAKFIPDKNTNVTRAEFWTADATTDVDVYVYDDFDGSTLSNPLASKLNLSFDEAGYHSVALDSPLVATSGDDVIVVVKFTNESYGFPVVADPHGTIESGRTYISLSGSSGSWTDMGTISSGGYTGYDGAIRLRTSTAVAPAPTVTSITPNTGTNAGTVHITNLAGSNFQPGASVKLTRSGQSDINATNITVVNSTTITCDFDLLGAATGQWNVVVTNPDLQSGTLNNGFTVNTSPTAPTVTSITPASGACTETVSITDLAGTNFQLGASAKLTKSGQSDINAISVTVVNSTTITCDFDLNGAATGQWNVVVTNPDVQSGILSNGFTVLACPETYYIFLPLVIKDWPPLVETSLYPSADTTILSGYPSINFGGTSDMWVGYDHCLDPPARICRSLIRFNLSSIPAGASVQQAKLYLHLLNSCDMGERTHTATVYRISNSWASSSVTWNSRPSFGESYDSASIPSRTWTWYSFDVTNLVRGWVNGSFTNYGLMVRGPESSGNDSAQLGFATLNFSGTSYDPYLQITYTAGAAASGATTPVVEGSLSPPEGTSNIRDLLNLLGVSGGAETGAFNWQVGEVE